MRHLLLCASFLTCSKLKSSCKCVFKTQSIGFSLFPAITNISLFHFLFRFCMSDSWLNFSCFSLTKTQEWVFWGKKKKESSCLGYNHRPLRSLNYLFSTDLGHRKTHKATINGWIGKETFYFCSFMSGYLFLSCLYVMVL